MSDTAIGIESYIVDFINLGLNFANEFWRFLENLH